MTDEDRIADVIGDWLERQDRGEAVDPEEVLREHPDLAGELRAHFAIIGAIDEAGPEPDAEPRRIGDYRILREIGRGGMGVVYEAEQTSMSRRVALKVLSPAVTNVHQAIRRFRREARAAGQIHHTNIVPIYGMGEDAGLHYYAMELVEGRTLGELVTDARDRRERGGAGRDDGPDFGTTSGSHADFVQLAEAVAGVAEALEAAHQEGIIHRDVKPTNLLLSEDGTLKIVDFGLARLAGEGASMTVTGQLLGTPHYMSPEQATARRRPIDHRTDVYSLGATLYEVLTLRTPFAGDSLAEICSQIISAEPVRPRQANPRVPRDLETIVLKAMEKDRERRYATADEMARDLRRFAEGMPIRARRIGPLGRTWRRVRRNPGRAALVAAVIVLVAAGGTLALRTWREATARAELEYAALCARGAESFPRWRRHDIGDGMRVGESPDEIYTRAIALLPDRAEAYFARALNPARPTEDRLADLEAARARGLSERTTRLARAHVLRRARRDEEAADEQARARTLSRERPADDYFEARLLMASGEREEAVRRLTRVLDADPGHVLTYLSLRERARLRFNMGDVPGALRDFHALEGLGDETAFVRIRIASLWRRMKKENTAEGAFREALARAREKGHPRAWHALCEACRRSGELAWHARAAEAAIGTFASSEVLLLEQLAALRWQRRLEEARAVCDGALERHPRSAAFHAIRGDLALESGNLETARLALEQAIALDPDDAAAHASLAVVLEKRGDLEEALTAAEKAIELAPGYWLPHRRRDVLLRRTGRSDEARATLKRMARSPHRGLLGHHLRGHALEALGRHEEALAELDAALRAFPTAVYLRIDRAALLLAAGRLDESRTLLETVAVEHPEHPEIGRAHEVRGVVLAAQGDHEAALAAYGEALRRHECGKLHYIRGNALWRLGRLDEALAAYERAVLLDPTDPCAWTDKAVVLDRLERRGEAVADLERALEIDPDHRMALENLGIALLALREWARGLVVHEKLCEIEPDVAEHWHAKGRCLDGLRRRDQALGAYRKAAALDPENALTWTCIGMTLGLLDREKEAVEALDEALRLDPGSYTAWRERGVSRHNLGNLEEALADFVEAVKLRPRSADALFRRATVLLELSRHEEAVPVFDRVIELTPDDHRIHQSRGASLFHLRRYREALDSFGRAADLNPRFGLTRYTQGRAHAALRELEKAVTAYDRCIGLAPDFLAARWWRALALREQQRFEEALKVQERLREAWPENPDLPAEQAFLLACLGRFEEATEALARAHGMAPDSTFVLEERVWTLMLMGRFEEALAAAETLAAREPRHAYATAHCLRALDRGEEAVRVATAALAERPPEDHPIAMAYLLAVTGERKKARAVLDADDRPWTPFCLWEKARIHAVLGETEEALSALESAAARGLRWSKAMTPDPDLASVAKDPRYAALLRRLRRTD